MCVEEMDEDQITSNAVRIMQFAKAMLRESQPVRVRCLGTGTLCSPLGHRNTVFLI